MNHHSHKRSQEQRGPKPERLKIDGDWKEAIKRSLQIKRPPKGWPRPNKNGSGEAG